MAKIATNEKLIGYDTNGKKLISAHFICDTQSDLPIKTEYDDYILYLGCTAHCITEHTDHELQSGGVWVQTVQPPADYDLLTNRPQINGHILTGNQTGNDLGLQNALTFDSTPTQYSENPVTSGGIWTDQHRQDALQDENRAALIELVDSGAKNLVDSASGSGVRWINIPVDLPAGSYTIGFYNISGDDSRDSQLSVYGENFSGIRPEGAPALLLAKGNKSYVENVVVTDTMKYIRLYASTNSETSINQGVNYSVLFVCTSAAWKISQSFQPYRPSWQEMYDMILALQ